ncbi:facilitated trehalose transporter Tret1-like isoform X2 [Onthophagus taurus]|nr:facilitated trehalose transporter Tret1-like isoform X2 [Onthophagus taurus]XP_022905453.1 facilitated trehalose transporter Tret1-like isoform X2 [Onthophagus taurus]
MMDTSSLGNSKQLPQYVAALSACLGSIAAGTVLGWTANINELLRDGNLNGISVDEGEFGWIGSIATLGAMLMCFSTGFFCNIIGRKWTMLVLVVPFTLGWLLIICAENVDMIYAGRFFTGLAGGAFCIAAPLYTSEISENSIRGRLGSFFQLLLTVGILLAYTFPLIKSNDISSTLIHTILCAIFPLIFGVVFFFQPETPVHLYKKGKIDEAEKSLRRLRGNAYNPKPELEQIKNAIEEEERMNKPFFESMKTPAAKKASLICFSLMFFQQMGGINAVIFYTGKIFGDAKIDLLPQHATLIIGGIQVVATFISTLFIDKVGRKLLLLISGLFMGLSTLLLAIYFSLEKSDMDRDIITDISFLPVLALSIFITVFSLGFGPIPWLISSELFPIEIKAIASSAAGTFNWLLAFIVTRFYNDIQNGIGTDITFYIFSGLSFIGVVFIFFVVPETKGKSFDEIQEMLGGQR